MNRAYPDRVRYNGGGHGNDIRNMRAIIHDFIHYNRNMQPDLGKLLRSGLSTRQFEILQQVAAEASSKALPIFVVGGLLRDLVLGRPVSDFDVVVEGDAIRLARTLSAKLGGQVASHPRFGTAKWTLAPSRLSLADAVAELRGDHVSLDHIDLISARSEEYLRPGDLPDVKPGGIDDDLRRRDFTINTLAVRLDGLHFGEVHDPFGALTDLEQGIVRTMHAQSFRHDPTRMFRAVRYQERYGFKIAPETRALLAEARPHVRDLSAHRIRQELDRILGEDRAALMISRLSKLDLLAPIHQALPADRAALRRLKVAAHPVYASGPTPSNEFRWIVWLIELSMADLRSINRRLHFRKKVLEDLLAASRLHREAASFAHWKPSRITAHLQGISPLAISAVQASAAKQRTREILADYLDTWRHLKPSTTGRDLKRMGLEPGPAYRQILGELHREWLDGGIRSQAEELARLESLLRQHGWTASRGTVQHAAHKLTN